MEAVPSAGTSLPTTSVYIHPYRLDIGAATSFVGHNFGKYWSAWTSMSTRASKASWHWPAFLLGPIWMGEQAHARRSVRFSYTTGGGHDIRHTNRQRCGSRRFRCAASNHIGQSRVHGPFRGFCEFLIFQESSDFHPHGSGD